MSLDTCRGVLGKRRGICNSRAGEEAPYALCIYDTHDTAPSLVRHLPMEYRSWRGEDGNWDYYDVYRQVAKATILTPDAPEVPSASYQNRLWGPARFSDTEYFDAAAGVIVQLVNQDGLCMKSEFAPDDIRKNDRGFNARK